MVCFHLKVWPVGKVSARESSDLAILRGTHLGDIGVVGGGVCGVLIRILGFLEEFEVGLLLEARVLRRVGVGGVEGGCGMGLLLFIVGGSFSECIK